MIAEPPAVAAEVARSIGLDGSGPRPRRIRPWMLGLGLAAALGAGAFFLLWEGDSPNQVRFKTAEVSRGDLTVKVTATGTLQPMTQVDVGTEVSGTIDTVAVDYNDRVKAGQILARLDPDQPQAKVRQSQAALTLAEAGVAEAQATVTETANKLRRTRDMIAKRLSTPEELDTTSAAAERAVAALAVAKAKVEQAQAQLDSDRRTLEKTEIRSPIDGTVLRREVEPGQTVAASLQTPVLFTLAEDLTQMELNVAVDEADVGQVAPGQPATFNVDAYPSRTFPAKLTQLRYAPETVNGVVTYAALLTLDNADLSLRPGMTATAEIVVRELQDTVLVPNAALRFTPPRSQAVKGEGRGLVGMLLPGRPPSAKRTPEAGANNAKGARVWTLKDGIPVPLDIKTGATDGALTEVLDATLMPGTEVLVDVERTGKKP
jgi:HlyD family secretion protein